MMACHTVAEARALVVALHETDWTSTWGCPAGGGDPKHSRTGCDRAFL